MKVMLNETWAPDEAPRMTQQRRANKNMINTTVASPMARNNKKGFGEMAGNNKKGFGEMAGASAAECAAVCCCCPCAVMDILVLAVVKVPAGLCRKARRRQRLMRRKKKRQQSLLVEPMVCAGAECREELEREIREILEKGRKGCNGGDRESEALDLEKETWDQFWGTGFWRSPSQREVA